MAEERLVRVRAPRARVGARPRLDRGPGLARGHDGSAAWVSSLAIEGPLRCAGAGSLALLAGSRLTALDGATGAHAWTYSPGPSERVVTASEITGGIAAVVTGRPAPARVVVLDHEGHVVRDRELAGTAFVFAGDRVLTNVGEIVRLSDHARVGTLERAPRV